LRAAPRLPIFFRPASRRPQEEEAVEIVIRYCVV
jgi:hypothetical protein